MLQEHVRSLEAAVRGLDEEMLLMPEADVVQDLVDTYRLEVPVLNDKRMVVAERGEVKGRPGVVRIVFAIPFEGQPGLFSVQPTSILMASFDGVVRDGELRLTVQIGSPTKETIDAERDKWVERYRV